MNKLSIVTVNLNNSKGLGKTIQSILSQTFTDFEYIIIDGGSNDGSHEVLKEHTDKITFWVSEPDSGIYNAMNKGILKATGEYCLFLNSGDWLADENVVSDFCKSEFKEDIISGNMIFFAKNISFLCESLQKEDLSFEQFYISSLPHQASFIKRILFSIYGLYNEKYKIVSDWEFFLKCLVINNCTYNHFNRVISYFDHEGISSQQEWKSLMDKEREMVFQTHLPLFHKSYVKICDEKANLLQHEIEYEEYMNLKNGKFSFFIKLFLFLKSKKKL